MLAARRPGELAQLIDFIDQQDIRGVVLASGDVHLGYLLHEKGRSLPGGRVGSELWELTSSPSPTTPGPRPSPGWAALIATSSGEVESLNYGLIDVDLDRPGEEIRLILKDERGAVLFVQPIALDQLAARPAAAVTAPLPLQEPAAAPAKLCPVVWSNGKAYFFHGARYVRYDLAAGHVDRAFPQPIAAFWRGIWPTSIDAAVLWSNGKAYFFKGSRYYAYDVAQDRAEPGPRDVSTYFRGLWPGGVDAGLVWNNGKAYFFKGAEYIRYDLARDSADPATPDPSPPDGGASGPKASRARSWGATAPRTSSRALSTFATMSLAIRRRQAIPVQSRSAGPECSVCSRATRSPESSSRARAQGDIQLASALRSHRTLTGQLERLVIAIRRRSSSALISNLQITVAREPKSGLVQVIAPRIDDPGTIPTSPPQKDETVRLIFSGMWRSFKGKRLAACILRASRSPAPVLDAGPARSAPLIPPRLHRMVGERYLPGTF